MSQQPLWYYCQKEIQKLSNHNCKPGFQLSLPAILSLPSDQRFLQTLSGFRVGRTQGPQITAHLNKMSFLHLWTQRARLRIGNPSWAKTNRRWFGNSQFRSVANIARDVSLRIHLSLSTNFLTRTQEKGNTLWLDPGSHDNHILPVMYFVIMVF